MATAKEERQFAKEREKALKERHKAYKAAKKAGTLDERIISPEHIRYMRRRAIVSKVWPFFRFLILFGLCFVILYPLIYMFSTAFRPNVQMTDPSVIWLPKSFTMSNMIDVWETMDFGPTLWNTIKLNIVCSLLSVVVCAITGYGLARFNFKGKGICFALVIMQIIVPPQITVIPLYLQYAFFKGFGLVKLLHILGVKQIAYSATQDPKVIQEIISPAGEPTGQWYVSLINMPIVMYAPAIFANGIKSGLFIFIFRQFFRGLPIELEDAAYLDGCGPFKTFIRIMVPNASTSFLTVFLFAIVWYWNDFYISSTFFTSNHTVALQLRKLSDTLDQRLFSGQQVGTRKKIVWLESGCLLSIAPILVMYVFLQKYFTEGLARSGLTGM